MNPYRRFPASPADWFSADEVAKAKSYQRPLVVTRLIDMALSLGVLLALIGGEIPRRLTDAAGATAWPVRLLLTTALLVVALGLVGLPLDAWRTLVWDRRWGFSTQSAAGWAVDEVKGMLLGFVLFTLLFLPVWALIRATDLWWLLGWGVFLLFGVALAFLYPVLIAPIFNKFTPLDDEELSERLRQIGRDADVRISGVEVMDASKRTRKDNAFFAGLGRTRRVVLFDNLLQRPRSDVEGVVAHEIGHWRRSHTLRMAAAGAVTSLFLFAALRAIAGWEPVLRWAGLDGIQDPVALPLVALVFSAGSALTGFAQKWLSRAYERQADLDALELTKRPEAFIEMIRGLSERNLADVAPSQWAYLNATHPPPAERMAMASAWADVGGDGGSGAPVRAE